MLNFFLAVPNQSIFILPPNDQPPSLDLVLKIAETGRAVNASLPPSIMVEISQSAEALRKISGWNMIATGGAALCVNLPIKPCC
jgi:hypothetical protein